MDPRLPLAVLDALLPDRESDTPLQQQLCEGLRRLVQSGALKPGQALPSSRALADHLRVSRNTAIAAYDRLAGEGYVDVRPRTGLFVSLSLAGTRLQGRPAQAGAPPPRPLPSLKGPRPFRPCQPDVRLFPLALWNRLRARSLRQHGLSLLRYLPEHPLGLPELRRVLAGYLRENRGVRCEWWQIAITCGSQQGLYLLAQLLLQPGSRVAMEDPGYVGARLAWLQRGAIVEPVPVDEQGLRPPEGPGPPDVALVYTTPSRQFPSGASLPVARRLAWLRLARRSNAWIVEDDYDSEFRYGRPPLPSMHSLDVAGRVIYVGSMSKVLFPSLRIGYAVLPEALVERFSALRAVADDHGPLVDQAALAAFIESGAFYTHVRRCRRAYGERQQVFRESARRAGWPLVFPHVDGGMNLMGRLPAGTNDRLLSERLSEAGYDVPPLSSYCLVPRPPGLVFGYTAFDVPAVRRGVAGLTRLLPRGLSLGDWPSR